MFDFPIKESTVGTSLYCLLFYVVIVFMNYRYGLKHPFCRTIGKNKKKLTIFLIGFFLVTHCLQGDFFHMMKYVYEYSPSVGTWNFGEEVYQRIGLGVGKNYFLFRTIVWGGAFSLFCLTAKRMKVPVYYAAILLLATHSIIFAYARVTLAMAIYSFGLSFLCRPIKSKVISYIIGLSIICISLAFHRTAVIMAAMTIMIFIPMRKWSIAILLLLLPTFAVVLDDMLSSVAMAEGVDYSVSKKVQYYSDNEMAYGISGMIISTLEYASFYVPFVLTTICIFSKGKIQRIPIEHLRLYKVALGFVLISLLFLMLGSSYATFAYRTLFMSMIPLTLIVVKLYQCNLMNWKSLSLCVWSGISYAIVKYVYTVYCHLV